MAGTRVYEDHRQESLKIMEETESKKSKILELLAYITERLKDLDDEKEELKQFQVLDKQKRACEYALYSREQVDATEALNRLEEEYRNRFIDAGREISDEPDRASIIDSHLSSIAKLEKELLNQKTTLIELQTEIESGSTDITEVITSKAQLEISIQESDKDALLKSSGQVKKFDFFLI